MNDIEEIRRLRRNRATWKNIATLFGMNIKKMMKFAKKHNLLDGKTNRAARNMQSKCQIIAERKGFDSMTDAIRHYRQQGMKHRDTAKKLGISPSTMARHYPEDIKRTIFIKSKKFRDSTMNNIRKAHEANRRAR